MSHELGALSADFVTTRNALHQVAFFVVAAKRYREVGRLGLRAVGSGFATPVFGDDEQVLVEGTKLIWKRGPQTNLTQLTTVAAAASFLEIPYQEEWFTGFRDPLTPMDPNLPLSISEAASFQLGEWFGFASAALETARRTKGAIDVSEVQLWPEHFDPATEMGSLDEGRRASYGGSPGDGNHPEPYLYVAAWGEIDRSNVFWNDKHFNGASLGYSELMKAHDPTARGLEFLADGYRILGSG